MLREESCQWYKTLVVHGQNECDIPTQLPVHEDTQFEALLKVGMTFNRTDFFKCTMAMATSLIIQFRIKWHFSTFK